MWIEDTLTFLLYNMNTHSYGKQNLKQLLRKPIIKPHRKIWSESAENLCSGIDASFLVWTGLKDV